MTDEENRSQSLLYDSDVETVAFDQVCTYNKTCNNTNPKKRTDSVSKPEPNDTISCEAKRQKKG